VSPFLAHAHFEDLGAFEWALVIVAALIGGWSIWLAVRYTLRPGEEERSHPKYMVLDEPATIRVSLARPAGGSGGGAPAPSARTTAGAPAPGPRDGR
jgi:hypothetical protein